MNRKLVQGEVKEVGQSSMKRYFFINMATELHPETHRTCPKNLVLNENRKLEQGKAANVKQLCRKRPKRLDEK